MTNVLLINPSYKAIYKNTNINEIAPPHPVLSLAALAAPLLKEGNDVKILDLNLIETNNKTLIKTLKDFKPNFVGITFSTPLFPLVKKISDIIKNYNKNIKIIGGGPHASSLPEETLKESLMDIVVIGEGDFILPKIISGKNLKEIESVCFKDGEKIIKNTRSAFIKDLDVLPFPSWNLYDIKKYKASKIICKKNPVGFMETSRGCVFNCSFCNRLVCGQNFRTKSTERTVDEMEYMLNLGFKEIFVVDDGFTTNLDRAKNICKLIIKRKLDFPWTLVNGIRVDRTDLEIFKLLKKAGCYRVAFGIESGNQKVLKELGKNFPLTKVREAVNNANKAKIETLGSFIIGSPTDTEETIKQTIRFAKSLNLTLAKFGILIPYPGTRLFDEWESKGYIKNKDWGMYNIHKPSDIYQHPNLNWDKIYYYYKKAYKEFYIRPDFIMKRIIYDIKERNLINDGKSFVNMITLFFKQTNNKEFP